MIQNKNYNNKNIHIKTVDHNDSFYFSKSHLFLYQFDFFFSERLRDLHGLC